VTPGGVLALDLSQETGWAYGHTDGPRVIEVGRWLLPKLGGWVAKCAALENVLGDFLAEWQPCLLVLESPLPPMAQTNITSARQQYGLDAIARLSAYWASVPVTAIDAQGARLAVLGKARWGSDKDTKREVVRYCWHCGVKVTNHHEADAVILWMWHTLQVNPPALQRLAIN
jgi:hypothetical protein